MFETLLRENLRRAKRRVHYWGRKCEFGHEDYGRRRKRRVSASNDVGEKNEQKLQIIRKIQYSQPRRKVWKCPSDKK